jgi:hypothetical protein
MGSVRVSTEKPQQVALIDGDPIASVTLRSEREEIDGLVVERVLRNGRVKPVYSEALGQALALLIASGHTYSEIEDLNPELPRRSLITGWRVRYPEFRALLESAKPALAENMLHELIDVSRASNAKSAMADKVKSDNLKWAMSKLGAKAFGDKLDVQVTVKGNMAAVLEAARLRALAKRASVEPAQLTAIESEVQSIGQESSLVSSIMDELVGGDDITGEFDGDEEAGSIEDQYAVGGIYASQQRTAGDGHGDTGDNG